ncbi:MAG: SDR family NAD(P)-dependent oxidoreductase, partial [Alphaproteobacteria bacterium]|nr:SDR family NAD(P)-dependent oxidoreductase [Alphaproteobacteria bacterium]
QVMEGRNTAAYAATKHAVLALSEGLQHELTGTNIGISVLAPSAVDTPLYTTSRNRPERFGGPLTASNEPVPDLSFGLHPDAVGRRVLRAIRKNEFYVFTHVETRDRLARRGARMIQAVEETEAWIEEECARS